LASYCSEFLVHGVDVEGKRTGIEEDLVRLLGEFVTSTLSKGEQKVTPVTYAGGVRSLEDLELVKRLGNDQVVVCLILYSIYRVIQVIFIHFQLFSNLVSGGLYGGQCSGYIRRRLVL